jgi:hypothetical protein
VHLFIGTRRSLCEITFIPFTTDYNHDTNYHGPICLFIFKSVNPSSQGMSLCRSSLEGSFGVISVLIFRRCFFLQDLRRRSRPPTTSFCITSHHTSYCINDSRIEYGAGLRKMLRHNEHVLRHKLSFGKYSFISLVTRRDLSL